MVDIVKKELELGMEISQICEILDKAILLRWTLVNSTRKLYLDFVKKILTNQFVLVMYDNIIQILDCSKREISCIDQITFLPLLKLYMKMAVPKNAIIIPIIGI